MRNVLYDLVDTVEMLAYMMLWQLCVGDTGRVPGRGAPTGRLSARHREVSVSACHR